MPGITLIKTIINATINVIMSHFGLFFEVVSDEKVGGDGCNGLVGNDVISAGFKFRLSKAGSVGMTVGVVGVPGGLRTIATGCMLDTFTGDVKNPLTSRWETCSAAEKLLAGIGVAPGSGFVWSGL